MPVGNLPGWNQIFETNFPGTVPLGAFNGCGDGSSVQQTQCSGLRGYGNYYNEWWAYPSGWPDTAKECIQAESSCPDPGIHIPVGGVYEPQNVVSVSNNELHIDMFRPSSGGEVQVATVVPRACMGQTYGRYSERLQVSEEDPGFKSAHLLLGGRDEIDYPENDYGDTISAYTNPGGANFSTNAYWTSWHTTVVQWTPSSISFYMDGNLIGSTSAEVPHQKMDWILQNESSILGPYASPGATARLNIAWVTCYALS